MYTLAMAACNADNQWDLCLALLDQRRDVAGAGVDGYAYAVAIRACAGSKQAARARELLNEMEGDTASRGNAFAWNNAMVACNCAGEAEEALALYDRMRAGACEQNEHSIAAAIGACGLLADWQRAQSIFDGAKVTSDMVYDNLLATLGEAEKFELVLRYFDAMKAGGGRPSARAYERAIEACDRVDADRSLVLFEEMRASSS